ncbi:putative membrane protein [Rubidibacter lacunae KORDI 51-2]|uniref:Dolichol-phosphate mannosyltransferase n=1 Tax=Rubidibacter lacunae KORDI 51-2 TaxID=582515 RepID=U5DDW2_9CHRO|nr:glycosyltransferase [Rubidibacter lacunae]ERN42698.1 putative membrane protein [Rubidibacter lacunae KORDI 51-2]
MDLLPPPTGPLAIAAEPLLPAAAAHSPLVLSVVLPTHNEADNLQAAIDQITQVLEDILPGAYELIVVDDDSPDDTWQVAQKLSDRYPQLRVVRRTGERGLSSAVVRGWQVARGDVLGVIDADLQHPPELMAKLWAEIARGVDLAVASRHIEGGGVSDWRLPRRFLSRGAQILGLIVLPGVLGCVSDPMSGYFMVRRKCLLDRELSPIGYKILIEVVARGRVAWIGEVGYVFQERQAGESKVSHRHYIDYIQHLVRLRFALWPVQRFLRFGIVGFSGVFVDMGAFYVLRDLLGLGLTRGAIASAELAIFNNFVWNDLWTFGDISARQRGWRSRLKRLVKFNLVCLAGLILNVLLVNLQFNVFDVNEYLAKLVAIAAVTLWNFWINLKLNWRVTESP